MLNIHARLWVFWEHLSNRLNAENDLIANLACAGAKIDSLWRLFNCFRRAKAHLSAGRIKQTSLNQAVITEPKEE